MWRNIVPVARPMRVRGVRLRERARSPPLRPVMYIARMCPRPHRAVRVPRVAICTTHLRSTDACGGSTAPRLSPSRRVSWPSCCHSGRRSRRLRTANPVLPGDYPDPSVIRVRRYVLGHGDDLAVGAALSTAEVDRPRELDARRRRLPGSPRVVGRQLLGAGNCGGSWPILRLLHRAPEERPAVRRRRRRAASRRGRTPITGRWSARRPAPSMQRWSSTRRASGISCGRKTATAARCRRPLGAAALRRRHGPDRRPAARCSATLRRGRRT